MNLIIYGQFMNPINPKKIFSYYSEFYGIFGGLGLNLFLVFLCFKNRTRFKWILEVLWLLHEVSM